LYLRVANSNVLAIFDGQVSSVVFVTGSNYCVIINHGRFYTVYQNLVSISVKPGDKVKTKQSIGKVFTDSESKSAILHFMVWEERKPLNPEIWLSHN
jgi:murein DD-endopeptidase MepM/ murein hydrolase activator NlpD